MPQDLKFQFDGDEPVAKKASFMVEEPKEAISTSEEESIEEIQDESIEEIQDESTEKTQDAEAQDSSSSSPDTPDEDKPKKRKSSKKFVIVDLADEDDPQIIIVTEKPKSLQEKSKVFKVTKEFTPTRKVIKRKSDKDPMEELIKLKEKNPIIHHVEDGLIGNFNKIGIKYGKVMQVLEPLEIKQKPEWHVKKAKGYLAYFSGTKADKTLEYQHVISETGEFVLDDDKLKDCYEIVGLLVYDVPPPGKRKQVSEEAIVFVDEVGPMTHDDVIDPEEERKYRKKAIYVLGDPVDFKVCF